MFHNLSLYAISPNTAQKKKKKTSKKIKKEEELKHYT